MWKERINSDDVFILDAGLRILQFNGANANKDEQLKGAQYVSKLKSDRPKAKSEVSDEECDGTRQIMKGLRDGGPPKEETVVGWMFVFNKQYPSLMSDEVKRDRTICFFNG